MPCSMGPRIPGRGRVRGGGGMTIDDYGRGLSWHGHPAREVTLYGLEGRATRGCRGTGILPVGLLPTAWKAVPRAAVVARASCPWGYSPRPGRPCHPRLSWHGHPAREVTPHGLEGRATRGLVARASCPVDFSRRPGRFREVTPHGREGRATGALTLRGTRIRPSFVPNRRERRPTPGPIHQADGPGIVQHIPDRSLEVVGVPDEVVERFRLPQFALSCRGAG